MTDLGTLVTASYVNIEDRRPNANIDPYIVTRLIVETCCTALAAAGQI